MLDVFDRFDVMDMLATDLHFIKRAVEFDDDELSLFVVIDHSGKRPLIKEIIRLDNLGVSNISDVRIELEEGLKIREQIKLGGVA